MCHLNISQTLSYLCQTLSSVQTWLLIIKTQYCILQLFQFTSIRLNVHEFFKQYLKTILIRYSITCLFIKTKYLHVQIWSKQIQSNLLCNAVSDWMWQHSLQLSDTIITPRLQSKMTSPSTLTNGQLTTCSWVMFYI